VPPRLARLYWQITALPLAAHFAGIGAAWPLVLAVNAVQVVHAWVRLRRADALPVQVHLAYLGLLVAGTWPPLQLLHLLQFVGVNALLVADYCLLARVLVLMPWNRTAPLSLRLVVFALTAPPVPGSIADRMPGDCGAGR
jgi:hypothetical protein